MVMIESYCRSVHEQYWYDGIYQRAARGSEYFSGILHKDFDKFFEPNFQKENEEEGGFY